MILCITTYPETAHDTKTFWLIGGMLASVAYGILPVLAYWCVQAPRRRKRGSPYVNRGLIVYVLLVVVITTAAEIFVIQNTRYGVLDDTCIGPHSHVFHPYVGPSNIINFLITLLTDSLLVWRCYVITSDLRESQLLWLIPLFSYFVMLGLSIALTFGIFAPLKHQKYLTVLFPLQLGSSAFVHTLITSIIVTLLFRYRRMLIRLIGKEQRLPLLNIVTILIESAALIVLMNTAVIVTVTCFDSVGDLVCEIWNFAQPIASFLIIDRVSRDSDYFSQKKEEAQVMSALNFVSTSPPSSNTTPFPQ